MVRGERAGYRDVRLELSVSVGAATPPLTVGAGSLDIIDPAAGALIGSFPLGTGNPGGQRLAVDRTGSVAVATSHTFRWLFAVDIRGLADLPRPDLDPTLQRPQQDVAQRQCHRGPDPRLPHLPPQA